MIHVTMHSDGTKMEGIQSISTSVLKNPICQKRAQCPNSVCSHCYANHLCSFRKSLAKNLAENYDELNDHLLTKSEAAKVNVTSVLGRIESFGDVASLIQARNYLRIIRANKVTRWGIWSKNGGIWAAAFHLEGKPRNCTFVLSSEELNKPAVVPPILEPYVDHVFTVWEKAIYDKLWRGTESECAGIRCMSCQKCYKRKNKKVPFYINERLR